MSLQSLTRVERAKVLKGGRLAGWLSRERGSCVFRYDDTYDGPGIAHTIPRGVGPVAAGAGAVPPYFAGLLPEGRRLVALRRAIKTSADDDFSLLLAIGHDPIGDVQVVPLHADLLAPEPVEPAALAETTFAELFERVIAPHPADRRGLPGVQPKVSQGMISLPVAWGQRPSILKLEPPEYPGVVHNEAHMLRLARTAGLRVPEFDVIYDRVSAPGLLVARFDRVEHSGVWVGRAQEDACQVLGLYPADKYRPSMEEVLAGLARVCGAPRVAAWELFRGVVFAYLTCNGDAHAKNFSVLQHPSGEWRPSPCYDQVSTHPYGDTTMALSIDGRWTHDIGRKHLLSLGAAADIPPAAAARVVDAVADVVEAGLEGMAGLPYDTRRVHKLRKAVLYRLARVRERTRG